MHTPRIISHFCSPTLGDSCGIGGLTKGQNHTPVLFDEQVCIWLTPVSSPHTSCQVTGRTKPDHIAKKKEEVVGKLVRGQELQAAFGNRPLKR